MSCRLVPVNPRSLKSCDATSRRRCSMSSDRAPLLLRPLPSELAALRAIRRTLPDRPASTVPTFDSPVEDLSVSSNHRVTDEGEAMPQVDKILTRPGEPTEMKTYGIHHSAFPCWDPIATVKLYRDTLGFSIPHAIPALGWGNDDNPDMVHFFFDVGNGDTIAFFYYFGWERPEAFAKPLQQATHPAIEVPDEETLLEIEKKLVDGGYEVFKVAHEAIESIYHWDPNGLLLEFTRHLRPFDARDVTDAAKTMAALEAALEQ